MIGIRPFAAVAAVWIVAFAADPAAAQQVNPRKKAPPQAESGVQRVIARAELQAKKEQNGGGLKNDKLTVNKTCGPVQIGGTPAATDKVRPDSLVGSKTSLKNQENTTVAKNIVNICR